MGMADVFQEAEHHAREQVNQETWGHLAPTQHRTYHGHIVFAVGCFGNDPLNPTILEADFGDLDDSPWAFDALTEFVGEQDCEPGTVHRFDGTFCNYEFDGTITQLTLTQGSTP